MSVNRKKDLKIFVGNWILPTNSILVFVYKGSLFVVDDFEVLDPEYTIGSLGPTDRLLSVKSVVDFDRYVARGVDLEVDRKVRDDVLWFDLKKKKIKGIGKCYFVKEPYKFVVESNVLERVLWFILIVSTAGLASLILIAIYSRNLRRMNRIIHAVKSRNFEVLTGSKAYDKVDTAPKTPNIREYDFNPEQILREDPRGYSRLKEDNETPTSIVSQTSIFDESVRSVYQPPEPQFSQDSWSLNQNSTYPLPTPDPDQIFDPTRNTQGVIKPEPMPDPSTPPTDSIVLPVEDIKDETPPYVLDKYLMNDNNDENQELSSSSSSSSPYRLNESDFPLDSIISEDNNEQIPKESLETEDNHDIETNLWSDSTYSEDETNSQSSFSLDSSYSNSVSELPLESLSPENSTYPLPTPDPDQIFDPTRNTQGVIKPEPMPDPSTPPTPKKRKRKTKK